MDIIKESLYQYSKVKFQSPESERLNKTSFEDYMAEPPILYRSKPAKTDALQNPIKKNGKHFILLYIYFTLLYMSLTYVFFVAVN
jgi:hypothetical protein